MALRVCLGCGTAYAVGIQACPQCGSPTRNAIYDWEDDVVAHANPHGATLFIDEGQDVPADTPEGVRMVGPGAPVEPVEEPAEEPEPEPEVVEDPPPAKGKGKGSTPPPSSDESSDPADDADADES